MISLSVELEPEDLRLLALYQAIVARIDSLDHAIMQTKDASEIDQYLYEHLSLAYARMRWDLRSKRDEVLRGRAQYKRHIQERQARIQQVKPGQTLLDYEGRHCQVIRWNRGKVPSISARLPSGKRKAFPPYHFRDVAPEEVSSMNQDNDPHTQELLRTALDAAVPLRIWELRRWGGPNDRDRELAQSFVEDFVGPKGTDLFFKSERSGATAERFNQLAEALAVLAFLPGGVHFLGLHFEAEPVPLAPAPSEPASGTPPEEISGQPPPPESIHAAQPDDGGQWAREEEEAPSHARDLAEWVEETILRHTEAIRAACPLSGDVVSQARALQRFLHERLDPSDPAIGKALDALFAVDGSMLVKRIWQERG